MASRFLGGLLIIGCVCLSGCWSADDVDGKVPSTESASMAPIQQPSAPSLRYLAVDEMASAVVVAGHSLVYTSQILPVGADGELVGEGSAEQQIDQVLSNLASVLAGSGSGLNRLVKVNAYVDSPETMDKLEERLLIRLDADGDPAVSAVVSPLLLPKAVIAVDAIAIADDPGEQIVLRQCEGVAGDDDCAHAAVMPSGGVAYLSGQPDKSPLVEATVKSMRALMDVMGQLGLQPTQIVRLKVFVDSVPAADKVLDELKKLFPDQLLPPVTFVEWIASAPIEIEVVMHLPRANWHGDEPVRFFTPSGVKPSPTFSKVALVQTDRQIFVSGLAARQAGSGAAQVRDVFIQLQQVLEQCGSDLRHLAKATYYVSDEDASDMLNKLRPEYYDPERPPAASKAMVHGVGRADRTLSIDMIAVGTETDQLVNNPEDSP